MKSGLILKAPLALFLGTVCCELAFAKAEQSGGAFVAQDVKEVLAPKVGDVSSSENVAELFSKTEDNYSLLKKGDVAATLDIEYSYFETVERTSVLVDDKFLFAKLAADSQRTITSLLNLDYGLSKNTNLGLSVPIVLKNDEQSSLSTTDIGDVQLSFRWQPQPSVTGKLTTLLYVAATLPTGSSPYEVVFGEELSTGQGSSGLAVGATFFKVFDPVIGFGSISYMHNFETTGLSQARLIQLDAFSPTMQGELKEVDFGGSLSGTIGLSYAITYDFTMTLQYQHTISGRSTFLSEYMDSNNNVFEYSARSVTADSGTAKLTAGWKGAEGRYMNVHLSFPMTDGQPDLVVGVSLPLLFR